MRILFSFIVILLGSCATFDPTNIPPGQRVPGPGYAFMPPNTLNLSHEQEPKSWSAVEYATSHKIHLFQLNDQDTYAIVVSLNKGPFWGMYKDAETHLEALRRTRYQDYQDENLVLRERSERIAPEYGKLCVSYRYQAEDWQGRIKDPVIKEVIGLACEFPSLKNVLISIDLIRRAQPGADSVDLDALATELFSSFEYFEVP